MRKKRLLFVIINDNYGGGERVFTQIINGLPLDRYQVFVASIPGGEFYQAIKREDVTFIPVDFSRRVNPLLVYKLLRIVKEYRIDLVHGQAARAEFYARIAAGIARVKYVSTVAMPVEGFNVSYSRRYLYCMLDHITERFVDRFLVCSETLRKTYVLKHLIPEKLVTRIYNGIEIDLYSPGVDGKKCSHFKDELRIPQDTVLIGAIGRMVWQKGFEHLVRAIPHMAKELSNFTVLFVGDGELRNDLEQQCKDHNIDDRVIFSGFRSDIKEILSFIDVLVIPSLREGFPMVTLEAMAMARPIVATSIAGIVEQIIDMKTGLLVPPEDSDALAGAVVTIVQDKILADTLARNAREYVIEHFSIEKIVQETEKVYQVLLG